MRRAWLPGTGILLVMMALPPAVAAIPSEAVAPERMPMAITQPIAGLPDHTWFDDRATLPESGLLVLVGTALMGLASIVRRSTRA